MKPLLAGDNVRARCPNCDGAVTLFEAKAFNGHGASVVVHKRIRFQNANYDRLIYRALQCSGCGRGGMAVVASSNVPTQGPQSALVDFFPKCLETLKVPGQVPAEILAEFQEAELTASVGAWRAASAMLRSTLEKTLRANGYATGSLKTKIDEACADGVITEARARRAHEDIRVLGNDVLHDAWREVTQDEFNLAHKYAQRILEDLYDDRASVEAQLKSKGRL